MLLTPTEVSKDVIALLWEGDFVDGVSDIASFQEVTGVLSGVSSVHEAVDVIMKPFHYVWTCARRMDKTV